MEEGAAVGGAKLEGIRAFGAREGFELSQPCTSIPFGAWLPDQQDGSLFLPSLHSDPSHSCTGAREHSHPALQGQERLSACVYTDALSGLLLLGLHQLSGEWAGGASSSQTSWNLGCD